MSRAEYLWAHMASRFGHTWVSQYGDDPNGMAGHAWNQDLQGLSRAQLDAGIAALRDEPSDFPPSAPRFRAMCFGIPPFAAVNVELLTRTSSQRSAFARMVWQHVDGYQHRHAHAKDAERMRRDAYAEAARLVMAGEALPGPISGELEFQGTPPAVGIPKTRDERVQRLREVLGGEFRERAANRRERV